LRVIGVNEEKERTVKVERKGRGKEEKKDREG
jgi:hypothetical protein